MELKRKPEGAQVVTPKPYIKVKFNVSNRAFYDVANDVHEIGVLAGVEEPQDEYTHKCDYEGDLETIIVWNEKYIAAILKAYEIDIDAKGMNLHLSCM